MAHAMYSAASFSIPLHTTRHSFAFFWKSHSH